MRGIRVVVYIQNITFSKMKRHGSIRYKVDIIYMYVLQYVLRVHCVAQIITNLASTKSNFHGCVGMVFLPILSDWSYGDGLVPSHSCEFDSTVVKSTCHDLPFLDRC